jgi:hypothetical protein
MELEELYRMDYLLFSQDPSVTEKNLKNCKTNLSTLEKPVPIRSGSGPEWTKSGS